MVVSGESRKEGAFISYAREDGEVTARALHKRLAMDAPDIVAWLDRYEIEGGVGWWNQVEQALDRAEYLILVMTPAALRSDNTSREWRSARQRGVCVYPIKGVPDIELDYLSLPNWMLKAHFYDPNNEWQKLIAHLRRGCQATRVPFMAPPLPNDLIKRQRETDALLGLLLPRQSKESIATTTVLRGPGGFGKTTLAATACHDERTIDTFDDGILWVTLGQSPNLLNELIKVYAALTGERPGFVDVEDAAREFALKLESKSCLIVVDDVWALAHVQPFLQGGVGCARLITTRLLDLTIDAQRIRVDQMTPAEALQLLFARTGVKPAEMKPFRDLVSRLGQWPLAIKLAGSAMRQRIDRGGTVDNALDFVVRTLEKRGITAFDREQASGREDAVMRTVGASLDLLKPEEQHRYTELAIFREDDAISITTAATLWQFDDIDSEDLARKLDDLALVEFDVRRGTLRLHDVLFGFIADRLSDASAVHGKLVDAWGDPHNLPDAQAWRSYSSHLRHAGREIVLRSLLLDPRWLTAKLRATDIHSLLEDFEHVSNIDRLLGLVRDALRLSAPALAADPQQLCTQLVGRTLERTEPEIVALREETALCIGDKPWLRLLHPTLDMPGGMLMMTLTGHSREVTSLAIDADYRRLVSASKDGGVRIWDTGDGRLLNILTHYNELGISAVVSSGDAQIVLGGGADGLIYKWDVARGEEPLCHFSRDAGGGIRELAASSDMRIAVSTARVEPHLRVWDVSTRALLYILMGHSDEVLSVAMSADGARAVSGSSDCSICVWNLRIGKLERTLKGHSGPVNAVALTTDGRYALSGSSDCTVKFWDVETGICLHNLLGHKASVLALGLAENGKRGISGASDSEVILWDTQKGGQLAHLNGHSDAISAVIINDVGTKAATGSVDCTIKLWRIDNPLPLAQNNAHTSTVSSLVFSPDGRLCASGSDDGGIKIHEVESGLVVRDIDVHTAPIRSLAFTQDCECVLSGDIDGAYRLYVSETGDNLTLPIHHLASVDFSAMSAAARYLMTSCRDRFLYLWGMPSGVLLARYGTRRLFDHLITPSRQRQKLTNPDEYLDTYLPGETVYDVVKLYMSGDGVYVILSATARPRSSINEESASQNKGFGRLLALERACLLVINTNTWEVRSMLARQTEPISAFAIDACGTHLLWAGLNHKLELWDLERQVKIIEMEGHNEKVNAVVFSRDGLLAFSCSRDRTLRAWNLQTGQTIATFTADAALYSLALASDGSTIAVGDVAGRVHFLRQVNFASES